MSLFIQRGYRRGTEWMLSVKPLLEYMKILPYSDVILRSHSLTQKFTDK
ncbi:hypothetical protein [Nostoc sp. 'Peltigera membranacea cyanobiont' 210A]|nr:hypothetical protein [Nostoc sp. 'Peltigera membranacea cyanobiont' 210A]